MLVIIFVSCVGILLCIYIYVRSTGDWYLCIVY